MASCPEGGAYLLRVGNQDRGLRTGKLADLLTATAAGRHQALAVSDHQHRLHLGATGQYHRAERAGLGTDTLRVGGVLDIASGMDTAIRVEHCSADMEM